MCQERVAKGPLYVCVYFCQIQGFYSVRMCCLYLKWHVVILVRFYIGCDTCSRWFHGSCVGVSVTDIQLMTAYVCPECINRHNRGPLSSQQPAAGDTRASSNKCWVLLSHLLKHLEVCFLCRSLLGRIECTECK